MSRTLKNRKRIPSVFADFVYGNPHFLKSLCGPLRAHFQKEESINYYKAVLQTVGPQAGNSMRLFAIPGMGHCIGGVGCDSFDKLAVIDQWIETGKAPERIVASKLSAGKITRTHPICAYPKVAVYKGTGSTDEAENFVCAEDGPGGRQ
jgi:hypothetical protein